MRVFLLLVCLGVLRTSAAPQAPPADAPLTLTLQQAMELARANSPQILSAVVDARIAREDTVQAKAALLPNLNGISQYIYTQPNGTDPGVFISNDAPHIYNNQLIVHGEIYSPARIADYRKSQWLEAAARARADIARRGLIATVVQNYYAMVAAARKLTNAQVSQKEAEQFLDISQKLEKGGETAHSDTVKAQISVLQRQRETQDARVNVEKARLGFAVLLFRDFRQDFSVVDDLDRSRPLPPFDEISSLARNNSPEMRAAQAGVQAQHFEIKSARAAMLPTLSFDYFYGMNSDVFALHTRDGLTNLGSVASAQLNIPLWTWGAARSKVRQAELRLEQARNELSFTQRQLLANLRSFYAEADAAGFQIATLRQSLDLAAQSLKLTLLRYQAGEVTVLEVVDAQSTLAQARNANDDGMVRYRLALANLQTLTGAF